MKKKLMHTVYCVMDERARTHVDKATVMSASFSLEEARADRDEFWPGYPIAKAQEGEMLEVVE